MAGGLSRPSKAMGPKFSAHGTGNPADYQSRLTAIFKTIVGSSSVKVVQ